MIGRKIRCVVAMTLGALGALAAEPGRAADTQPAANAPSAADTAPAADARQTAADLRYRHALDAMLADVASPEASFEFVQAATAVGDLRGAVAALERMLLINPNLANIQLELGALYLQLGNPLLGRYHITRALQAPDVPGVVRARAERYLALAGAQAGRSFLHGGLSLGWRHESDANFAPNSNLVSVFDPFLGRAVLGQLGSDAQARADSSLLLAGQLDHSLALGSGAAS
jgi:tetratricopeptide (TPR) repeat protein